MKEISDPTQKFLQDLVRGYINDLMDDPIGVLEPAANSLTLETLASKEAETMEKVCKEIDMPGFWLIAKEVASPYEFTRFNRLCNKTSIRSI
jgi:hypothetical protein